MERTPASIVPSVRQRAQECGRGLGAIIDVLVTTIRQERFDQLRCRFEGATADALGWRNVRLTTGGGAERGRGVLREGAAGLVPVPGTAAVMRYEGGFAWGDEGEAPEHVIASLASLAALTLEVERLHGLLGRPARRTGSWQLVGSSEAIDRVRRRIEQVARTSFPVLVEGESGVGKEVVARLIHEHSRRARGPFVAVNCAAIVDSLLEAELFGIEDRTATGVRGRRGKFEAADGGTLFLDEIGDLSAAAQAKLLRVLQDYTIERVGGHAPLVVNVRVIAATNRSLARLVEQGRFRADLFYRLNGVEICIPPLRARLEDVPELVTHVLLRYREYGVTAFNGEAIAALSQYSWPGNVRELERVVERAIALAPESGVGVEHLPEAVTASFREVYATALSEGTSLRQVAAQYVRLVVAKCANNKREACRVLGISYHTLESYLRRARGGVGPSRTTDAAPEGLNAAGDHNDSIPGGPAAGRG